MNIVIVDYGMGNLRSVQNGFRAIGEDAKVVSRPEEICLANAVVLPGVGAFGDCMRNLQKGGLDSIVIEAIRSGKPFLGICLGLQVLFEQSREFGETKGLGLFGGKVVPFPKGMTNGVGHRLKIPHMGWNQVHPREPEAIPLFEGVANITEGAWLYFVHSFFVDPVDEAIASTKTDYGVSFVSSVFRDNVFACQFHPERSGPVGLKILENFIRWARKI